MINTEEKNEKNTEGNQGLRCVYCHMASGLGNDIVCKFPVLTLPCSPWLDP